jgi:putative oxidoreductase
MDIALFTLRLVVGALFIGHGAQKLFGAFGGHGIEGTAKGFAQLGYRPARRHAQLAGLTEFSAGILLALGLLTPLAAAMIIGVMVNAIGSVHGPNGPWITQGGYEYNVVLIASMFVVAATGPGVLSIDRIFGLGLHGGLWGLLALVAGVASGAAILTNRRTPEPAQEPEMRAGDGRTSAPLASEETLELGR